MHEIVIISGKGGTGKTSIAASLSFIAGRGALAADCDVDASDLHLLLKPEIIKEDDFYSGYEAVIDPALCNSCGKCRQICRFNAVNKDDRTFSIDSFKCEGCGYCCYICPQKAIRLEEQKVGHLYHSRIRTGSMMIHAKLAIGADNSGKLVAEVKKEAKALAERSEVGNIIIDGSPGIGCPVISSLSGADYVLIVTEPTRSALHDMKRVWELSQKFELPVGCIINKEDLNRGIRAEIKSYLSDKGIDHLFSFPYDNDFHQAITLGLTLVEYNSKKWKPLFEDIWNQLQKKEEKQ